jgi:hypothetical protein
MVSAIVIAALTSAAHAQLSAPANPGFAAVEAQENAANGKAGPRVVPGRAIPVPDTVSPQLRAAIAAPYRVPAWDADPKSPAEWKELISKLADAGAQARREAREKLGVTMEPTVRKQVDTPGQSDLRSAGLPPPFRATVLATLYSRHTNISR